MFEFIKNFIVDFIFPPTCPICHEIIDERGGFCINCAKKFLRTNYKKDTPRILEKVFCIANYREGVQKYLLKLKFENNISVVPILKNILVYVADNTELKKFLSQVDIVMFVPQHEERFKERGFDPNDLIFHEFFDAQNIPIEKLLIRSKNTKKLFDLDPAERLAMMSDAFTAAENISVVGKNILIADDIYTTGSTVSACAKVLKENGAKKIFVLAYSSDGD